MQEEICTVRTELDKSQRKLQHSMPRAQWEAVRALAITSPHHILSIAPPGRVPSGRRGEADC